MSIDPRLARRLAERAAAQREVKGAVTSVTCGLIMVVAGLEVVVIAAGAILDGVVGGVVAGALGVALTGVYFIRSGQNAARKVVKVTNVKADDIG